MIQKRKKQSITLSDFPQKIRVVCLATDLSFEQLAEKLQISSSKLIYNWYNGVNQPRLKSLKKFCLGIGIADTDLFKPIEEFCDAIAKKIGGVGKELYDAVKEDRQNNIADSEEILGKVRRIETPAKIRNLFNSYFKGCWRGLQLWKKTGKEANLSVYKSLLHFSAYDEETNTILCNFYPATIEKEKPYKPRYRGWVVLLGDNRAYYTFEDSVNHDQILYMVSNAPTRGKKTVMHGILLTYSIFESDKYVPSASRVLLKKIEDGSDLDKLINENEIVSMDSLQDEQDKSFLYNVLDESRLLTTLKQEPHKDLLDAGDTYQGYYYGYIKWIESERPEGKLKYFSSYYKFLLKIAPYNTIDDTIRVSITTKNHINGKGPNVNIWGYTGSMTVGSETLYFVFQGNSKRQKGPIVVSITTRRVSPDQDIHGILMADPDLEEGDEVIRPGATRLLLRKISEEEVKKNSEEELIKAVSYISEDELKNTEKVNPKEIDNEIKSTDHELLYCYAKPTL